MLNADVGSVEDIIEDGLDNRVVDEADVVDIFIVVVVVAASWIPHTTLKFPPWPPVKCNRWTIIFKIYHEQ